MRKSEEKGKKMKTFTFSRMIDSIWKQEKLKYCSLLMTSKLFVYRDSCGRRLNPSNPKIKIWILICCPYSFPTKVVERSLIKYQANSSCVIMSVILMTTLFYKAVVLQGEIWCWSFLGLKGLNRSEERFKKDGVRWADSLVSSGRRGQKADWSKKYAVSKTCRFMWIAPKRLSFEYTLWKISTTDSNVTTTMNSITNSTLEN